MDEKTVYLLFTGGWDSTFRFLQLAATPGLTVRTVYFVDPGRRGREYEMRAIRRIITKIRRQPEVFPATILKPQRVKLEDLSAIRRDPELKKAYMQLHKKYGIGIQYLWFAAYADMTGIRPECGVLCDSSRSKVGNAIFGEGGSLVAVGDDPVGDRKMLAPGQAGAAAEKIFGKLVMGIAGLSKTEEQRIAEEKGWLPIMELSWFCHAPVGGQPCGVCTPCRDAMNEGMEWRMPDEAKWRYRHRNNLFVRGWIWFARRSMGGKR